MVLLWCCFSDGVKGWWCFCDGVFVLVFLWWCGVVLE